MVNGGPEDWAELTVTVVVQLLVMLAGEEIMNPTVVFVKAIEDGVPISWQTYEVDNAGTVTGCPFTVMFWGVVCSCTCTVLYTPGSGSTLSKAAAPMTMLTVAVLDVAVKVWGVVQASGLGAPTPAVHGPVLSS
jgi:hypothetical protein